MKRWLRIILLAVVTLVALLGALMFTPVSDPDLASRPQPLAMYQEVVERIDAIAADEAKKDLIPEGHSLALLTGARADTCVVIFHGYTSVPAQFRLIAQAYRDQGYNVWVPRLPYHGSADKMTEDFSNLTARGLREFADEAIDVATGLGEHVIVIGFSGGGSLAAWSAVERPEVSQTVLISPLLHPLGYAEWQDRPLVRLLRALPVDVYNWWNADSTNPDPPGYNYPRFSLKGIAALLSMSQWADRKADAEPYPAKAPVTLVRNDGDQRLDSAFNERFVRRMVAPENLTVFRIPAEAGLLHNLISPDEFSESWERIDVAYEYLSDALGLPLPDPKAGG
jgi:pimeloyl-ACP methyl ester carboxylesterase